MGFVSFPASENEPATSGPGVAQRLAQVYKEYVAGFDQVYINSVAESRRKMLANNNPQAALNVGNGNPTQPQQNRGLSPQHMQMMVAYANKPVAELRALNLGDKMIAFIENNRPYLQRALVEQGMFRGQFQNQGGLRQADQLGGGGGGSNGGMGNPMNPFQQGPSGQPNVLGGFHPPFLAQGRGGPMALGRPQPPPQGLLPNGNGPSPLARLGTNQQQIDMARAFIQKTKQEFIQNSQFPIVLNPCLCGPLSLTDVFPSFSPFV